MKWLILLFVAIIFILLPYYFLPNEPIEPIKLIYNQNTSNLTISVIDVGQGDSVLVEYNNTYMLVDSGGIEKGYNIVKYLDKKNVTHLKYLVTTHDHEDHTCNIGSVAYRYTIDTYVDDGEISKYEQLHILDQGAKLDTWYRGEHVDLDPGINITVLNPTNKKYDNVNDGSIVLRIVKNNVSFLLTGDIEKQSEKEILLSGLEINSDILKVAHHGSSTSSTNSFLKEVTPEVSVISLGIGNIYGHPNSDVVDRLDDFGIVYRTDKVGTVEIITDGETYNVVIT